MLNYKIIKNLFTNRLLYLIFLIIWLWVNKYVCLILLRFVRRRTINCELISNSAAIYIRRQAVSGGGEGRKSKTALSGMTSQITRENEALMEYNRYDILETRKVQKSGR